MTCSRHSALPLKRLAITGVLQENTFTCEVTQHYVNETDAPLEILYTFPKAGDVVITEFSCRIGDVKRRVQLASAHVSAAYLCQKDSSLPLLLEANSNGTATLQIGSLPPGQSLDASFRTFSLAVPQKGRLHISVPLCTGNVQPSSGRPAPSIAADYPVDCHVLIAGKLAASTIESASHAFTTERTSDGLMVHFRDVHADGAANLSLSTVPAANALLCAEDPFATGRWCGVLLITAPDAGSPDAALDLDILADGSGSMAGAPLMSEREALAALTELLQPKDRVTLTKFGTECWPVNARRSAFDDAYRQAVYLPAVAALEASLGGSNLTVALQLALEQTAAPRIAARRAVFLVTDGKGADARTLQTIASSARTPVFVLGVGRTAAQARLQDIAQATGGMAEFVLPGEDVLPAVARLVSAAREAPVPIGASDGLKSFLAGCLWTSGFPKSVRSGLCHRLYFQTSAPPALPLSWATAQDDANRMTSLSEIQMIAESQAMAQTVAKQRLKESGDVRLVREYRLLDNESDLLLTADCAAGTPATLCQVPEMLSLDLPLEKTQTLRGRALTTILTSRPSQKAACCLSQTIVADPLMRDAAPRPVSLLTRARAAVKRRLPGKARFPDEAPTWLNALFADMAPGVLMPEDPAEKDAAFVQSWWTAFARRLPDRVRKHLAERFAATLGEDAPVLSFEILAAAVLVKAALAYYPTNENHPDDEPSPVTLGRLADLVRYCGQDLTPYSNDAFLRAALQEAIT